MDDEMKKRIEVLVKEKNIGDDTYSQLIKQKLLYDFSLN